MELICTKCDGLGQERQQTANMHPSSNVAGWFPSPVNGWPINYWWRSCQTCAGTGYRPSGQSVPLVKAETVNQE